MDSFCITEAIKRTNALTTGHFLLSSGKHSDQYLQCAKLLEHPRDAERVGKAVANLFEGCDVDVVIGLALGGVILAYEVARALGVRSIFAERKENRMSIRRGFKVEASDKVLIIEDVVTTGGSVREVLELLRDTGANIVGVGSIIDRSRGKAFPGYVYRSLLKLDLTAYAREDCPLCKGGVPIVKPGSNTALRCTVS